MLLVPFVLLTGVGFVAWLTGHFFEYAGIAAIGAILIIAVGGGVALTDLDRRVAENEVREYTTVNNETVVNQTTTTYETEPVTISEEFGGESGPLAFGGLVMVIGGLLMTHTLRERSGL